METTFPDIREWPWTHRKTTFLLLDWKGQNNQFYFSHHSTRRSHFNPFVFLRLKMPCLFSCPNMYPSMLWLRRRWEAVPGLFPCHSINFSQFRLFVLSNATILYYVVCLHALLACPTRSDGKRGFVNQRGVPTNHLTRPASLQMSHDYTPSSSRGER